MPFAFTRPVLLATHKATGLPVARVEVTLTVLGGVRGDRAFTFLLDTGAEVTTVGEDVAASLGLPPSGPPVRVGGSTGEVTGRQVSVRLHFPPESNDDSGARVWRKGLEVSSTWVVVPGSRPKLALLGLHDVHQHFALQTTPADMVFYRWTDLPAG